MSSHAPRRKRSRRAVTDATRATVDALEPRRLLAVHVGIGGGWSPPSAAEGGATATFQIDRHDDYGEYGSPLEVNVGFRGIGDWGFPAATADDVTFPATVTFPAGEREAFFDVVAVDDDQPEQFEAFEMYVLPGDGYEAYESLHGTGIIENDVPNVWVTSSQNTAAEGDETANPAMAVFRRDNTVGDLTVRFYPWRETAEVEEIEVAAPRDAEGYYLATFADGEDAVTVPVTAVDDAYAEPTEQVSLHLIGNAGRDAIAGEGKYYTPNDAARPDSLAVNVRDDDVYVSVAAQGHAAEGDPAAAAGFRVTRDAGDVTEDLKVYFDLSGTAAAGTDYTTDADGADDGYVTIPAGAYEAHVNVFATDDQTPEWTEEIKFAVRGDEDYAAGTAGDAAVELTDDDASVVIDAPYEVGYGALIPVNSDDDDSSSYPDSDDDGAGLTEDDLVPVSFQFPEESKPGASVTISLSGSVARLWNSPQKGGAERVVLDDVVTSRTWIMGQETPPRTLWLEALGASSVAGIVVLLQISDGGATPAPARPTNLQREAAGTALNQDVDLDVANLDEKQEDQPPGGIVPQVNPFPVGDKNVVELRAGWNATRRAGELKLSVRNDGAGRVRVWRDKDMTSEFDLSSAFDPVDAQNMTLWVSGEAASSTPGDVQVELKWTNSGITPDPVDTVKLTVSKFDLDIDGVTEAKEDSIGGVVVRTSAAYPVPRRKVIVRAAGFEQLLKVSGSLSVFTAQTGGTPIKFDGIENRVAAGAKKDFWVESSVASKTTGAETLSATPSDAANGTGDSVTFTVLWVEVGARFDKLSDDNDAGAWWVRTTKGNVGGATSLQGPIDLIDPENPGGERTGLGVEYFGKVTPSDFDAARMGMKLHLNRDTSYDYYTGDARIAAMHNSDVPSAVSGPKSGYQRRDLSPPYARDDTPGANGKIYDLDLPGFGHGTAWDVGDILRIRANFKAYAVLSAENGTDPQRASDFYTAGTAQSYKRTSNNPVTNTRLAANDPNAVPGDDRFGPGEVKLTWDLK